jgi:hypothetical protein
MDFFLHVIPFKLSKGVIYFFLLAGAGTILASSARTIDNSLPPGQDQLTITLQAPLFELNAANEIQLLSETDRYTYSQPEGQPLLPHRQYNLGLPPDADFTSLELHIDDAQVDVLPGTFQVPLANPLFSSCAPTQGQPEAACGGIAPKPIKAMPAEATLEAKLSRLLSFLPTPQLFDQQLRLLTQPTRVDPAGVKLLQPGQMRKWRFARLDFAPFLYDSQHGRMSVVRSATVRISYRRDPALVTPKMLADSVLDDVAPLLLDNFTQVQPLYDTGLPPAKPQTTYDYLIITTSAILNHSNLTTYVNFLEEHGHHVFIQDVANVSGFPGSSTAARIRSYLKYVYLDWALRYVLLVGNPDPGFGDVPMQRMWPNHLTNPTPTTQNPWEKVPTDAYYSNLTGEWDLNGNGFPGEAASGTKAGDIGPNGLDFTPSVFVGRIPVYNADYAALNHILDKTMAYMSIIHRQDWQSRALFPMTFNNPTYDEAVMGYVLDTNLMAPNGITSHRIYMNHPTADVCNQVSTFAHDEDVGDHVVINYWSANPVGLMVLASHGYYGGTGVGYGTSTLDCGEPYALIDNNDLPALNDSQPAFTFHAACANAEPEHSDNIAYMLLRQGAVATVGGTRATRGSDLDTVEGLPYTYDTKASLGYNYVKYLMQGYTAGEALPLSKALFTMQPNSDMQNHFGYNLYGDPALVFFVPPYPYPLGVPTGLYADPLAPDGHQLFKLHWQDNSKNEEYYRITLIPNDMSGDVTVEASRNAVTASALDHTTCGKSYSIKVQAVNRSQVSAASNIINVAADPCPPAAPSNLSAALNNAKVVLTWNDNSNNEAGFSIYRSYYAGFEKIGQVGANMTTYSDPSAQCYQTYSYYVKAFNITGDSPSNPVTILSARCPPVVPIVHAGTPAETSISLSWTDDNDDSTLEDGFEVWSKPVIGRWRKVTTLPADTINYIDTSVLCDSDYVHKVVAFNAGGRTESAPLSTGTSACAPPAAPSGLAVESVVLFKTEVRLTWYDNSYNEWGFKIERQVGANWVEAANVGHNQTATHITGLTCGTAYTFRIYAYNTQTSDYSSPATGSTAVCDTSSPIHFGATTISQTRINLSWNPAAGRTPVGYNLIRSIGMSRTHNWEPLADVAEPTHTYPDTGLTCGTTYFYSIRSVFATPPTHSLYVSPVSATTLPCVPGAPSAFSVTPVSQTGIVISWLPPVGADQDGYYLERAYFPPVGGKIWLPIATLGADATWYEDSGLTCNTINEYRVQAYNAGGSGAYSAEVDGWTAVCTPLAPSDLHTTGILKDSLSLAWSDNSDNETGFHIERSGDSGVTWASVGNTAAGVSAFDDTGLTCGTPYSYRVMAFNSGGEEASPVLETITRPCNPILTATPGPEGLVSLSWSDPGQGTTLYILQRAVHGGAPDLIGEGMPDQLTFRDLDVPCGLVYDYFIVAINPSGESDWPAPVVVTATCKPSTVITLVASSSTHQKITLTWSASAGGQTSYLLMRSVDGQDNWQLVAELPAGDVKYIDYNLAAESRYYYRLWAVNSGGEVASNMVSATTLYAVMLPMIRN